MKGHLIERLFAVLIVILVFSLTGCTGKTVQEYDNSTLPTLEVKNNEPKDSDIGQDLEVTAVPQDADSNGQGEDTEKDPQELPSSGEEGSTSGNNTSPDPAGNDAQQPVDGNNAQETGNNTQNTGSSAQESGNNTQDTGNDAQETGSDTTDDDTEKKYVVVLDPGHGGYDSGAYYAGRQEKDLTLKVSMYARDYLINNYDNIEVYLTREDDTIMDRDKKKDLEMRCDLGRQVGADCLVSIHFNATEAHLFSGSEIWISRRSNVHDATLELGNCIMQELVALGLEKRSVSSRKSNDMFDPEGRAYDYYAINRHCAARDIPGIIVEQCFMDSEHDQKFIESEEGLQKLGEANAKGIASYLGLETKE